MAKIILNKKARFIKSFQRELNIDCTLVEILSEDNINEDYFLLPNIDYKDYNYKQLKNKKILVVQFPEGKNLSYSEGELIKLDRYEFTHKASTKPGSSGSPVFLEQTTKVIGIHKQESTIKEENYGDFIFPIINALNNNKNNNKTNNYINYNNNMNKQNEVKIKIKLTNLGYFVLFGPEFVENNKDKLKVIINGKEGFELKYQYWMKEIMGYELEIVLKETKIITNMNNMFQCGYIKQLSIDFEKWDTSNVTSMKEMLSNFGICDYVNIKGISNLDTSNVTDMSYMFAGCENIPDISNWDTSKVIDMSYMFMGCENIPDISNWDTSKVVDMSYMFKGCKKIPDISNWNTSNVKNLSGLFYNSVYLTFLPDISKWNIQNVENMSKMFDGCKSLKYLPDISKWELYP